MAASKLEHNLLRRQNQLWQVVSARLRGQITLTVMKPRNTTLAARYQAYDSRRKSPGLALAIEYVFTPLGHGYAGDWGRGLWPAAVTFGGFAMFAYGADRRHPDDDLAALGFFTAIGGKVWAMISAWRTAQDTNRALREQLGLTLISEDGRAYVGIRRRL